jgi:hypothetical protein
MMAAPINTTGQSQFNVGVPKALFPAIHPSALTLGTLQYAVTRDGKRFLVNVRPQQSSVTPINVVINWMAALQK